MKPSAIALLVIVVLVGTFYYLWHEDDVNANGKLYSSKQKLCMQFALSYLRTIKEVTPEFSEKKWQMAIDIETEMYNLCMRDLNE